MENTHQQLKAGMEQWALGGHVEHRGQRFSADRFHREASESADAAKAIERAAAELMAESEDPRVLNMALHLGGTRDTAFYSALLDRLEGRGPALPEAAGVRYETLREDMLWKLSEPHPATTPELSARAQALLEREEAHHIHLAHLHHDGSGQQIVDVLEKVSADKADPWLVALVGTALAKRHPDHVLAAAAHVAKFPQRTRELFLEDVRRAMSDAWLQGNGPELQKVLQLPDR